MKVHFIYRKPNPGNFSIESIYNQLIDHWENSPERSIVPISLKLRLNYDLWTFLKCWVRSLLGRFKIVHITGGCNYMILAFPRAKRVLTIHDLYHLEANEVPFKFLYRLFYYSLPVRYSHKIVTVSEQTKKALIAAYPKARGKVEVIQNPLNAVFYTQSKEIDAASKPSSPIRILQIGDKKLKNYERLIKATHQLKVEYTFIHAKTDRINALIKEYQIQARTRVRSNLSTEELIEEYLNADLLYFASTAEGFGLPLIEAQSLGLPIITSNRAPMNTVAPYAFLVNPERTDQIEVAVEQMITEGASAAKLRAAKEAVSLYRVEAVAKQYCALYLGTT
ncbi:glycosyltransferase [Gilvibacter sp.]|uniref:glycosyltransferase n=1 Tax=Gilvibacter sp. TaxID=2729997 RepID=UPI0025BC0ED9|nr:glycosyltransferase [Gilvibacter sp.]NQX76875.1 glycosyltransferase [Gilvibacter sp.]